MIVTQLLRRHTNPKFTDRGTPPWFIPAVIPQQPYESTVIVFPRE